MTSKSGNAPRKGLFTKLFGTKNKPSNNAGRRRDTRTDADNKRRRRILGGLGL